MSPLRSPEPREPKPVPKGSWSSPYWDASRMRTLEVGFRRPEVEMRGISERCAEMNHDLNLVASCIIFRLCFCGRWQHDYSVNKIMICHCGENFFKFNSSISACFSLKKSLYFKDPIQLSGEVSNPFQSIVFRWDNPTGNYRRPTSLPFHWKQDDFYDKNVPQTTGISRSGARGMVGRCWFYPVVIRKQVVVGEGASPCKALPTYWTFFWHAATKMIFKGENRTSNLAMYAPNSITAFWWSSILASSSLEEAHS